MKNLLKSLFISLFPLLALYAIIISCFHLFTQNFNYVYLGTLITALPIVFFFSNLFIKPVARTDAHPKAYTFLISLGFITSIISNGILYQDFSDAFLAISLFLGWVLYLKWYSIFSGRKTNHELKIGTFLPNLEFEDSEKNKVMTSSFKGNPAIFLFYRGNWCPLCMAQIKEISDQYRELKKRNVSVIFISPQPHTYIKKLANKFSLEFTFLRDVNNNSSRRLNIVSKNGIPFGFQVLGYNNDTVMPTVIITDRNGKIIFADQTDNYRVRPEPETFIKILDTFIG